MVVVVDNDWGGSSHLRFSSSKSHHLSSIQGINKNRMPSQIIIIKNKVETRNKKKERTIECNQKMNKTWKRRRLSK